jgi:hypothetical protein
MRSPPSLLAARIVLGFVAEPSKSSKAFIRMGRTFAIAMSSENDSFSQAELIKAKLSGFRRWLPYFDLTVSHPDLQARLWMHRWPVKHAAILKCKSRGVIWTNNTVAEQLAFRERPAEMRARLSHRENPPSATNKQNGRTIVDCTRWHAVRQFRFCEHGHKAFRKYFTSRAINTYSVFVHQLSAEMSR